MGKAIKFGHEFHWPFLCIMMGMKLPDDLDISALPSDGGDQFNRLIFETSVYLKDHGIKK